MHWQFRSGTGSVIACVKFILVPNARFETCFFFYTEAKLRLLETLIKQYGEKFIPKQ